MVSDFFFSFTHLSSYLILFMLTHKQISHVCGQHVLQQQPVQVLPGLDLILLRVVLIL